MIKDTPTQQISRVVESRSKITVSVEKEHRVTDESYLIIKRPNSSTVYLDHKTSPHVTIKSMGNTLIVGDKLIDEEFSEILLEKFASVELLFVGNFWYILSSDGLKNS